MLSSSKFWQTQHAVHGKDSNALPTALLVIAGVLVTYKHMTQEHWEGNMLKTFLALIMIQMLPLVLIELKMPSCPDPVASLAQFGSKVLLMHAFVLGPRAVLNFTQDGSIWDILYFAGACAALHQGFGFRLTLQNVYEHRHVIGLALLAMLTAALQEVICHLTQRWHMFNLSDIVISSCNYTEILAFVPAVWTVCRNKAELSLSSQEQEAKTQKKANYFFAFLVVLYLYEDVGSVAYVWRSLPLAAVAHVAHFLLVLDFAFFMLAHLYSPEKIKEGLMKMTASFGAGTLV